MLKPYFLTTKSNLMTKFKMNGKNLMMALSFFAFMILGSVSATAQWVSTPEAVELIKAEVLSLDNEFAQATTNAEKEQITFEKRYYLLVGHYITEGGLEVPAGVTQATPTDKPKVHSSGLVEFTSDGPDFKQDVATLIAEATDMLSN